jgi:hypothetical protein
VTIFLIPSWYNKALPPITDITITCFMMGVMSRQVDPHPLSQEEFCLTLKELHPKQLSNLPVLWALASTS